MHVYDGGEDGRGDRAGAEDVDPDPFADLLAADSLGEVVQGRLAGPISAVATSSRWT